MIEPLDRDDRNDEPAEWREIEALVRAAGHYVRPSEELRPRVLEAARRESMERSVRRRICHAALALGLLLGAATGMGREELPAFSAGALRQAELNSTEGGAIGWSMVESFTDLRRRQANLLRFQR
jgi:hypothetical protein